MIQIIEQLNREKAIFWTLLGILFLSVGFYLFCINTTVRNVVSREKMENESIKIALDISNKEFQYISMKNSITISLAYALGFKDSSQKTFLSKNSNSVVSYVPKGF